jgi:hypothetical protein
MPSYLKYRIKQASESTLSPFDRENIPENRLRQFEEIGYISQDDQNIKPHTCTFISKVKEQGEWKYYCGIKRWTSRYDLIASDDDTTTSGQGTPTGEFESRVSGALKLNDADTNLSIITKDHFQCKYCDSTTAKATTSWQTTEEFVEFVMCNCYTPRGGMAISAFDGAVQGHLAPGYVQSAGTEFPNVNSLWTTYNKPNAGSPPNFAGPIPAYFSTKMAPKVPATPKKIGMVYMMLNTRANVVPCCWWTRSSPIIYTSDMFRVIDLGVAAAYRMALGTDSTGSPDSTLSGTTLPPAFQNLSKKLGESDLATYQAVVGDFWYEGDKLFYSDGSDYTLTETDAYQLNSMFSRRYDPTLPECGNNRRIVYALRDKFIAPNNKSLPEDKDNPDCSEVWHSDRYQSPFSPRNCGHPNCSVKYEWGHVCNGGGAFSLVTGKACPYYTHPIMGDKDSKRYAKLQNMYAGDSITGAAILEMMWLSKGGIPWTEEEWKNTWLVPHIWTTIPFNPDWKQTDVFTDDNGRTVKSDLWHAYYDLYARKTTIDPSTGKVDLGPQRKLPGGSMSMFERKQNKTLSDADRLPDIPSIIRNIDLAPRRGLNIVWPVPDLSLFTVDQTDAQAYADALVKQRRQAYNKLIWNRDGLCTQVIGQATRSEYSSGLYCVNTAFLTTNWSGDKEALHQSLADLKTGDKDTQKALQDLWYSIEKSQVKGGKPVLAGMSLLKTETDEYGVFVFEKVPLSCLESENHIIVFGFSSNRSVDATMVTVAPIFRRGYPYQSKTKLMNSWKTVWNGRPSIFLRESSLAEIIKPVEEGQIKTGEAIQVGSWFFSSLTGDLLTSENALQMNITYLEAQIQSLQAELGSSPTTSGTGSSNTPLTSEERSDKQLELARKMQERKTLYETLATVQAARAQEESLLVTSKEEKQKLVDSLKAKVTAIESQISESIQKEVEATANGQTMRATAEADKQKLLAAEKKTLEDKIKELEGIVIPEEKPDSDKIQRSNTQYSYKNKEKSENTGDADNDEGGIIITDEDYLKKTAVATMEQVDNLYIPFLNGARNNYRNIDKYTSTLADEAGNLEEIRLEIPEDAGLTTWKYQTVPPNKEDIKPLYSFPGKAAKKVVVYSTRATDNPGYVRDPKVPVGAEVSKSSIIKWYRTSSCSSTFIIIVDPKICHANSEFMIFSMSAKVTQKYLDAQGQEQMKERIVQFVPMNYSQVSRPFPGYTPDKTTANLGTTDEDGITYHQIQISEDVEIIEKSESGRHPWIFFVHPVEPNESIKEWRYYNKQWYPLIENLVHASIPKTGKDDEDLEIYMEYAYIAKIYDENEADAKYEWKEDGKTCKTRILLSSPKAGIMRTVFAYKPDSDKIDGFETAPMGAVSMATLWPYARYACRDYEIMYIWQDRYRGQELTTGNAPVGTSTAYAASKMANSTAGQDKIFTMADVGDHDLGTEFQPKLTFNSTTIINNGYQDVSGQGMAGISSSETFTDMTKTYLNQKDPTYGFPVEAERLTAPPTDRDALGALYFPYTRSEPGNAFVPRHKTYPWEFIDRYRNKPKKKEDLGSFRMQAYDWCVRGTNINRVKEWRRHWIYDPRRETKFLGRSKTRGPVFQLEYREYYDLPTKTVVLSPYVAQSAYSPDHCYCAECNRYFSRGNCKKAGGPCPLCGKDTGLSSKTGWASDWMYLVRRQETDAVVLDTAETLTETELAKFTVRNPDKGDYNTWKEKITQLYNIWKDKKDTTSLDNLQREQARGRARGWLASIINDLEFTNDQEATRKDDEEQQIKTIVEKSEFDVITGCDKYGLVKRKDLGAFQLTDEYVPGSINPYYGADPNSADEMNYKELQSSANLERATADTAAADYERFKKHQDLINQGRESTYAESGTVYASAGWAAHWPNDYTNINEKVEELKTKKEEAELKKNAAASKITELNQKTARGQARDKLNALTEKAVTDITKHMARYYEYEQTSFGYNYPWSPFDSPPLFGNTGRELFVVEMCTIGSVISWLPKDPNTKTSLTVPGFPAIPSWWTARDPEGQPKELVTLLAPPTECSRALPPLSSEALNPYYYYLFDKDPFAETVPEITAAENQESADSKSVVYPNELRIITQNFVENSGQPTTRSDAGRLTLTVTSGSNMNDITIVGSDSASYWDSKDNAMLEVTGFATDKEKSDTSTLAKPLCSLEGYEVKGFAVAKSGKLGVGDYYPGFYGPYNYGKTCVGFQKVEDCPVSWAWPESVRDKLKRALRVVTWNADIMPPPDPKVYDKAVSQEERANILKEYMEQEPKYVVDTLEEQGLWAISSIVCAPYFKKMESLDDGREISCGPKLKKESKEDIDSKRLETAFAIIVESERIDDNGKLRPPLIWVEEVDTPDISEIGHFKVPSNDSLPHIVKRSGTVVPAQMKEGDENKTDNEGRPDYNSAFSTGEVTEISHMDNPTGGANLLTSKGMNEAGYYPGFIVGSVNYRTLGKVFVEKEASREWYDKIRLIKQRSIEGQNQHKVSTKLLFPRFVGDVLYIEVKLVDFFDDSLKDYLSGPNDEMAFEVVVTGIAPDAADPLSSSSVTYLKKLPYEPAQDDEQNVFKIYCDLGHVNGLSIQFTWYVRTDPGNFNLGPWKSSLETKIEDGKTVENTENYSYIPDVIDSIKMGILVPGKCAEIVKINEVGFYYSKGKSLLDKNNNSSNFFTEQDEEWYKPNWEEFDKKLDKTTGWWENSGRLTEADMEGGGVDKAWFVQAEEDMYTSMREEEEKNLKDPAGKAKTSSLGKEPKAEVFPKVCVEVPELPISRLKMAVWNAVNNGITPSTSEYPYDWKPVADPKKRWSWGGVWTTRLAGPEWVTADPFPSRDLIWWPALPYEEGKLMFKGRYFRYGKMYKDESPAINDDKRRGIAKDDDFNKYAYKYEVRGFDALLKMIESSEAQSADERRSAEYLREYGSQPSAGTKPTSGFGKLTAAKSPNAPNAVTANLMAAMGMLGCLGGGAGVIPATAGAAAINAMANMANLAIDGINNSRARNYRVVDQRSWVFLDQISLKVDSINWDELEEREGNQQKLYAEAQKLSEDFSGHTITFQAIIPYHDYEEIEYLSGAWHAKEYGLTSYGGSPIDRDELKGMVAECTAEWKEWSWEEIQSFTFRNEFENRYPLKSSRQGSEWKTILIRKCGTKWAHQDMEVDGGKIWDQDSEDFVEWLRSSRRGHPLVVIADCKRPSAIPAIGVNLEHFDASLGATECEDFEQKWKASSVPDTYPSSVSKDNGVKFRKPDPWWRF